MLDGAPYQNSQNSGHGGVLQVIIGDGSEVMSIGAISINVQIRVEGFRTSQHSRRQKGRVGIPGGDRTPLVHPIQPHGVDGRGWYRVRVPTLVEFEVEGSQASGKCMSRFGKLPTRVEMALLKPPVGGPKSMRFHSYTARPFV